VQWRDGKLQTTPHAESSGANVSINLMPNKITPAWLFKPSERFLSLSGVLNWYGQAEFTALQFTLAAKHEMISALRVFLDT
jgi:hypothetical protein